MNTSPATLKSINTLIARLMRRIQLTPNEEVRFYLRWAVRWLNMARKAFKRGSFNFVERHISSAKREVHWARQYLAYEARTAA